jgi:RNA polymerase sigma factor (sigma-70 family)
MTAVPNWDIAGPAGTDADLARAAAAGDRAAFAGIYDRYADRLHDFCVGMLRDRDGAADCVQDTFCIAATRLQQLQQPDKLRPWLYAIARNEALRRIRERRRETPSDELPDAVSHEPGPDTLAARTELADLIAEAAGGLSDRDRAVLELVYRHGLDGPDLAEALGVSPTNATKMAYRLRETVERSLGALLVSRRARNTGGGCPELASILEGWDGHFSMLMRKRISRHIESCPACDQERRRMVSPVALLGGAPVFIPAPGWLRERTLGEVQLTPSTGLIPAAPAPDVRRRRGRRAALIIVLAAGTLIATLGLTIAVLHEQNADVIPTDATEMAPQPVSNTPGSESSPTQTSPLPAPVVVPPESSTPSVAAPPAPAPPAPAPPIEETPIVTAPPPVTFEPDPPVSEPSAPRTPSTPDPATTGRARPSSGPSDPTTPRTTRRSAPTGVVGIPPRGSDPPKRTPARRVVGDTSR